MSVLADARWRGPHGIGRFAAEVLRRIGPYTPVPDGLPLLHPLEPVWLASVVRRVKPSVYFSPGFNPPLSLSKHCPLVFTLHDLIHLKIKEERTIGKRLYYEAVVRPAAGKAARVLTDTVFSKGEILEWTGLPEHLVEVVGAGVSEAFRMEGPVRQSSAPYFLFVGSRKPHKNLPRTLEAFAHSGLSRHVRLALTGDPDGATLRVAAKFGIDSALEFLGCISDADLAACYRGAVALVAPSLYEGFGIPPVEALACGCPVLAAAPAQLEVLGEAAIFVDPKNIDDISSALLALMAPGTRQSLATLGLRRCQQFSWNKTAGKVRAVLADAGHGSYSGSLAQTYPDESAADAWP
ncbi:MAG: glycosyltransferase family 4 protein [Bryobacteraceae bacterium]